MHSIVILLARVCSFGLNEAPKYDFIFLWNLQMMWQHPSFSSLLVAKPVETTLTNHFSLKASATETNDLQCFPTILQQQSQERGKTTSINIQPFNIQQC